LAERFEFQPDYRFNNVLTICEGAEAAVRAGDNALAVADHPHGLFQASRDYFRVLDDVAVTLHDTGQKQHMIGQLVAAQSFKFVLMARIAELDTERANVGLVEQR
jgi:hypothetical protein